MCLYRVVTTRQKCASQRISSIKIESKFVAIPLTKCCSAKKTQKHPVSSEFLEVTTGFSWISWGFLENWIPTVLPLGIVCLHV